MHLVGARREAAAGGLVLLVVFTLVVMLQDWHMISRALEGSIESLEQHYNHLMLAAEEDAPCVDASNSTTMLPLIHHIRIPRSGGQSLRKLLVDQHARYHHVNASAAEWLTTDDESSSSPSSFTIIVMRDPLERLLSVYNAVLLMDSTAGVYRDVAAHSIEEIVDTYFRFEYNYSLSTMWLHLAVREQVQRVCGRECGGMWPLPTLPLHSYDDAEDPIRLERALKRLERVDVVAVLPAAAADGDGEDEEENEHEESLLDQLRAGPFAWLRALPLSLPGQLLPRVGVMPLERKQFCFQRTKRKLVDMLHDEYVLYNRSLALSKRRHARAKRCLWGEDPL